MTSAFSMSRALSLAETDAIGFALYPVQPSDLETIFVTKAPSARLLLRKQCAEFEESCDFDPDAEEPEDWTLSGPSLHELRDTIGGFIRRAIIDLKYRAVLAEKIRPLLDAQIEELERYLYDGQGGFGIILWDGSGASRVEVKTAIGESEEVAQACCAPIASKLDCSWHRNSSDEYATSVFYYQVKAVASAFSEAVSAPCATMSGLSRLSLYHVLPQCYKVCPVPGKSIYPLSSFDLDGFAEHLLKSDTSNLVVLCGAGISTSLGLPDYRTEGMGLFSEFPDIDQPETLLSIDHFLDVTPMDYYRTLRKVWVGHPRHPKHRETLYRDRRNREQSSGAQDSSGLRLSTTHHFLADLANHPVLGRKLRRVYTQNVDGFELMAGVPRSKVVQVHGGFASASLAFGAPGSEERVRVGADSAYTVPIEEFAEALFADGSGNAWETSVEQLNQKYRNKCLGPDSSVETAYVKPDIVLYGQSLQNAFFDLTEEDMEACDALIVLGTSLKVSPFNKMLGQTKKHVPRLLVNRELAGVEVRRPPRFAEDGGGEDVDPMIGYPVHELEGGFRVKEDPRSTYKEKVRYVYRDVAFLGSCDDGCEGLRLRMGL